MSFRLATSPPFELLVATVLSQHTNDTNSSRALASLCEVFAVNPRSIAAAGEAELGAAIRVAGLHRRKAKILIAMAKAVLEEYPQGLDLVLGLDVEQARRALMALRGVGPKTADIMLLFGKGAHTFPVDTHVARVSARLGLTSRSGGYEETRRRLMGFFPSAEYGLAHLLLIQLGRRYCKAVKPRHEDCPLRDSCSEAMGRS